MYGSQRADTTRSCRQNSSDSASLTLADLSDLREGRRDPIVVGTFPDSAKRMLGIRIADVYLSKDSLAHIVSKHNVVDNFELLFVPFVIRHGMLMRERKKNNILISVYQDAHSDHRYAAVMKITNKNFEVWLQTFHRAHLRQTRAWLKRCEMIKTHDCKCSKHAPGEARLRKKKKNRGGACQKPHKMLPQCPEKSKLRCHGRQNNTVSLDPGQSYIDLDFVVNKQNRKILK